MSAASRRLAIGWPAIAVCLLAFGAFHWWSAPRGGDYWWPDSSRHMLNGVFVRDALRALPFAHPMEWAQNYYDQYPALTIGFYPPGFAALLGTTFLVAGATHAVAQAFLTLSFLLLALSTGFIARSQGGTSSGVIAGALMLTTPELLLWSRQIQPEVPALALAASAVAFALSPRLSSHRVTPWAAVVLFVAALYCKQTAIVLAPMLAWALWPAGNGPAQAARRLLTLGAFAALLLIPLAMLQLSFGAENLRNLGSVPDAPYTLEELGNWTWYGARLAAIGGWPLLLGASAGVVLFFEKQRGERNYGVLLVSLALAIYAVFSAISIKEQRHIVPILVPLVLLAGAGLGRLVEARPAAWLAAAALFGWSALALSSTAPRLEGFEDAARWVAQAKGRPCRVLVHAKQDGNFITDLRLLDPSRRCTVLRSDKLLFNVAVRREFGLTEQALTPEGLGRAYYEFGVSYVIVDPLFWNDLGNSRMLVATMASGKFVHRAQIPLRVAEPGHASKQRSTIEIFENVGPVSANPSRLRARASFGARR